MHMLFGFPVQFVGATKLAVLFQFQTILHRPFVLGRGIIPLLAFRACKGDDTSHDDAFFLAMEPTTRIELVTSSLPRMCSTD